MKNELIRLENGFNINYKIQVDTRNRRLNLYVQDPLDKLLSDGYFRKSDILNLGKLDKIHQHYEGEIIETYDVMHPNKDQEYTRIGCCRVPNEVLKSIQNKFKKMK
jgi:NRPS condensation-like uncharacterized protein